MPFTLHKVAFDHAKELIKGGLEVQHDTYNWDEVKPTLDENVKFLNAHDPKEYGVWFLGIDKSIANEEDVAHKYHYPYGDLKIVHKSALLASLAEAEKRGHHDIVAAINELLALIEEYK